MRFSNHAAAQLIAELDPSTGLGKPEPMGEELSGYWSRRIDDEYRLVYRADSTEVTILKPRHGY